MINIDKKIAALAFLFTVGVFVHAFLGGLAIKSLSATYDEPVHLTAGYIYLKTGDYRFNGWHHPPFGEMFSALPLLFMNPILPRQNSEWIQQRWNPLDQYQFADRFIFRNRIHFEPLIEAGRWMQIVLSCVLGVVLVFAAHRLYGFIASLIALGFWCFSPTFLSIGSLITTDLAFALFFFSFFVSVVTLKSPMNGWGAGLSLGLCLASKYFALVLVPIFVVCLFLNRKKSELHFGAREWITTVGLACFVLLIIYQFHNLNIFISGLRAIVSRSSAGRSSFFIGYYSTQGWMFYFPILFLLKTPLPLLLGGVISAYFIFHKKYSLSHFIWLPPVLFFLIACLSNVQIGQRHILVVYPFLILMVAGGLSSVPWLRFLSIPLLGWLFCSVILIRPHYLAYFNEIIGGASQGYKYFTDSNVDWGQSLKLLKDSLDPNDIKNGIYLSYFGVVDPELYGIKYLDVGSDTITGHSDNSGDWNLTPEKFAISVTNYQATYYADKNIFRWLDSYTPWKIIGYSILVYDFKNNPEAFQRLNAIRYPKK